MKKNHKKINLFKTVLLVAAISAICWDMATSVFNVTVPGTFKYESDFDVYTGASVKVAIVPSDYSELAKQVDRNVDPGYEQIEAMVRKAIELQGSLQSVVTKGNKVMVKVNLVGKNSPSGQGENTDVRVVKALVKYLHEMTEGDVEIVIAEGTARTNDNPTEPGSVWENSGYTDLLTDKDLSGVNLRLLNLNQTIDDIIEVDLGDKGMSAIQGSVYGVHKEELEADAYIVVPVLKIHNTGITNALKLQVGSAPGCYYGYNKIKGTSYSHGLYHDVDQRVWTTEMIVDLCQVADIDYVLVDAVMCLETKKTYNGSNQLRMNTVVAATDPVAADNVCAQLMGINPDDVAHITLAEKAGLGTNNPDKITVVGGEIDEAGILAKKSQELDGIFGQSNRTWILSKAFQGTDITKEYIENEASVVPKAGENGWSEPVYFFDDRIDLYNYYEGATSIVTYAFSYFSVPEATTAELWLGKQEAIIVYVNGEEVYRSTSTSTYGDKDRGDKKKNIELKEGENTLLVKSLNRYGDYSFALNICEVESNSLFAGNRVEGLKFYSTSLTTSDDIKHSEVSSSMTCYPNPVIETLYFNVQVDNEEKVSLLIYDLNGVLVHTVCDYELGKGKHSLKWNVNGAVPAGNYICTLYNNGEKISKAVQVK